MDFTSTFNCFLCFFCWTFLLKLLAARQTHPPKAHLVKLFILLFSLQLLISFCYFICLNNLYILLRSVDDLQTYLFIVKVISMYTFFFEFKQQGYLNSFFTINSKKTFGSYKILSVTTYLHSAAFINVKIFTDDYYCIFRRLFSLQVFEILLLSLSSRSVRAHAQFSSGSCIARWTFILLMALTLIFTFLSHVCIHRVHGSFCSSHSLYSSLLENK